MKYEKQDYEKRIRVFLYAERRRIGMVTFYVAIGRVSNLWQNSYIPQVTRRGEICELDSPEFIVWSSVIWNIYQYEELKKVFEKRCEEIGIVPDFEFDYYLQRLEFRQLIKAGRGCTAITALYSLLLDLYISVTF